MKSLLVAAAIVGFAAAACSENPPVNWEQWPYRMPVTVSQPAGTGVAVFDLPPQVFDLSREDNLDLRLIAANGRETAYIIRRDAGEEQREAVPATLYNQTFIPGLESAVTADFGGKLMKNEIVISTAGSNFRREVEIAGSDDGQTWSIVRSGAFLFRAPAADGASGWERDAIRFPDNDQRYLRIRVKHGPGDPDQIEIDSVRAWRVAGRLPRTVSTDPVSVKWTERLPNSKDSELELDLGMAKQPVRELTLTFADANFLRRIDVFLRNREIRTEKIQREQGTDLVRQMEEPWSPAGSFSVHRFSSGGSVDEGLTIQLKGKRARFVKIRIRNQDDAPLQFQGVQVVRYNDQLLFPNSNEHDYWLYFGNPEATAPQYDFREYASRMEQESSVTAATGGVEGNPAYGQPPEVPWPERHRWLVWGVLLAILVGLALLVYRQAALIPRRES